MKNKKSTILLIFVFAAGLSLLLYPTFSNEWNKRHASQTVAHYVEDVKNLNAETYDEMLKEAEDYNASLLTHETDYVLSDEQKEIYESKLNLNDTGIMGYLEIAAIGVSLPIYHGTEENVLQVAVGHMAWSSLPVGGESTHCVLSGHRGLPSARLFTDLDKLTEGDTFVLHVLDEACTYEDDEYWELAERNAFHHGLCQTGFFHAGTKSKTTCHHPQH